MKHFYCYNCDKEYNINCQSNQTDKQVCPDCGERIYELTEENNTNSNNTHQKNITEKELLSQQAESLHNIENMIKFFVVLAVTNIIITIISAISIASLF